MHFITTASQPMTISIAIDIHDVLPQREHKLLLLCELHRHWNIHTRSLLWV